MPRRSYGRPPKVTPLKVASFSVPRHVAEAAKNETISRRLHWFLREAWHIVEPANPFVDNWHIQATCEHLELVTQGKIKRLLMNYPPGTTKSRIVSVMWPCCVWTRWPSSRWMFFSYQLPLSTQFSLERRAILESDWYQSRWGHNVQFSRDQRQKTDFTNKRKGHMIASSVGGRATGEHPNFIVVDDPNDTKKAESKLDRKNVTLWWDGTISTRGILKAVKVKQVVMQQRVAEDDLSGHIIRKEQESENAEPWTKIILPMRYEGPGRMEPTPILNWADPRTEEGELLWPEQIPEAKVAELESTLGSRAPGQLQQRPARLGGQHVRQEWFRYFREEQIEGRLQYVLLGDDDERRVWADQCTFWFQTCDTAAKTGQENDYTVILTVCVTPPPACMLVHDLFRARLPIPQQYGKILEQRAKWPQVQFQAVEDASGGTAVIQMGRAKGTPFYVLKPQGDKLARAMPIITAYQNGAVYHRAGAWVGEYEAELMAFPTGRHDDQWDAAAYAGQLFQQCGYAEQMSQRKLVCWGPGMSEPEEPPKTKGGERKSLVERLLGRKPRERRQRRDMINLYGK